MTYGVVSSSTPGINMSKFIVLYNYNKYYNRIIKKPVYNIAAGIGRTGLAGGYLAYKQLITPHGNTPAEVNGFEFTGSNFDYEDGVFAKHVINIPKNADRFYKMNEPDYLVLDQELKIGSLTYTKTSRWFILETQKIRGDQWELSLRRDLLADFYDEAVNAPVFIEKGNPTINDPAIFNSETFTFNQIKKAELKLDFTKLSGKQGGWIVGYLARKETNEAIGPCIGQARIPETVYNYTDLPAGLRSLIETGYGYKKNPRFKIYLDYFYHSGLYAGGLLLELGETVLVNDWGDGEISVEYPDKNDSSLDSLYGNAKEGALLHFNNTGNTIWNIDSIQDEFLSAYDSARTALTIPNKVQTWYESLNLQHRFSADYSAYNGCVYLKDGIYYKLNIATDEREYNQDASFTLAQIKNGSSDLALALKQYQNNYILNGTTVIENDDGVTTHTSAVVRVIENKYVFTAEQIEFNVIKATIPAGRNENLDAPYDLFCIPIGDVSVISSGTTQFTNMANTALAIAQAISIKGAQQVYDIQILPYCPFDEIINSAGNIDITGFTEGKDYSYITKEVSGSPVNCGIIIYPKSCRGTFDMTIPTNSSIVSYCRRELQSPIEKKVKSETVLLRFVSPNFASTFDINPQKNNGISRLNVDYYYKPYSPYIHVAPYFSGLYGNDFNDPKGLICSGEFSITAAQSQWENYQIQNKNYELIFNRQIQNLDVNNSITMEQQKISSGLGVATAGLTGLAGGALAGGTVGGPVGAVVGAGIGAIGSAVTSAIGRKYDLEFLKKSQTEARSYAVDMYSYSLGNIQALPYSLTRVSALTENNKLFPFIEVYEATNEEKEALRNKILYNGMTVMRIGKVLDFITSTHKYVQGQLIRLEGIDEDSHVVAEIAKEIKEGAYFYGNYTINS